MLVCEKCGSTNIQTKGWVNPNTHKLVDPIMSDDTDDQWCEDCLEHVGFIEHTEFLVQLLEKLGFEGADSTEESLFSYGCVYSEILEIGIARLIYPLDEDVDEELSLYKIDHYDKSEIDELFEDAIEDLMSCTSLPKEDLMDGSYAQKYTDLYTVGELYLTQEEMSHNYSKLIKFLKDEIEKITIEA